MSTPPMFSAAAPVRLDFAGGWTDVPPFSKREGGAVVNAAIRLYARAEVRLGGDRMRLIAEDFSDSVEVSTASELVMTGRLDLLKAGLRMFPVGPCTLTTRSDAPAGSGLGSSGALDVALVAALSRARGEELDPREIAEEAWRLEAIEAGNPGGRQDQFAAALGGFLSLTFQDSDVQVAPLRLDREFTAALERQMVLCYTGVSRVSGATIERVMAAYDRGDRVVVGALHALKDLAGAMEDALRASDLGRVGALLRENWRHQQALDPLMANEEMRRLDRAMSDAGVLGGKAAGAGAGGSMFFLAGRSPAKAVATARESGVMVLPVAWASEGVSAC